MYDNGCQLDKFVKTRISSENRTHNFCETIFVVDRMHIKGHVVECQEEYHPNLYKHLDEINTSINEIRNSWISGYSSIVLHMNSMRYYMYFYILFDEYNQIVSEGKINICDSFKQLKIKETNKLNFLSSDSE